MRKSLYIPIALLFLLGILTLLYNVILMTSDKIFYSEKAFSQAITGYYPALASSEDIPIFKVSSIKKHDKDWYVVTIESKEGKGLPVTVVLKSSLTRKLSVILGPDTHFDPLAISSHGIPESIAKELQKQ